MKSLAMAACAALIVLSAPAFAQQLRPAGEQPMAGDTLKMSCGEAKAMVKGKHGVLLSSGPNRFDRYHGRGFTCDKNEEVMQPAMVRTKDNPLCFIGYTCEPNSDE